MRCTERPFPPRRVAEALFDEELARWKDVIDRAGLKVEN